MKIETFSDVLYLSLFRFFQFVIRVIPERPRRSILRSLAALIYRFDFSHKHIAKVNLDLAYGDTMPLKEKQRIIRKTYENLLFNLADFVENQTISKEALLSKVTFIDEHHLAASQKEGRPIILITAHYGSWETLPLSLAARYNLSIDVVGRPLPSRVMDDILRRNREQFNIRVIDKTGAMRPMINTLKSGRILGLLVDQNVGKGPIVDFFGREASHVPTVAQLAFKFDAIVIPVFLTSAEDHSSHRVRFYPPIEITRTDNIEDDIIRHVQAQASITEKIVREFPEQWFWLHKRWKNRYKALYQRS